jgi:hypothetical protein
MRPGNFTEYVLATKLHQNRKSTFTRLSNMAAANTGSAFENDYFLL